MKVAVLFRRATFIILVFVIMGSLSILITISSWRKKVVGGIVIPKPEDLATEFQHSNLSLKRPYFDFLNSFAPPISHTNSKPASINFLASFTVLVTLQIP